MNDKAKLLLAIACNPFWDTQKRRTAYVGYEAEMWYQAIHDGRMRLCDIEKLPQDFGLENRVNMQAAVYHIICARLGGTIDKPKESHDYIP